MFYYDYLSEDNELEFECGVCGCQTEKPGPCSNDCFEADMM